MYLHISRKRRAAVGALVCMKPNQTAANLSDYTGRRLLKQLLRVMQLTAVILLLGCLQVAARATSQNINYSGRNVPLVKVFQVIKRQTGLTVMVSKENLKSSGNISIDAVQMPLEAFLTTILSSSSLEFIIDDRTIIVRDKTKAPRISRRSDLSQQLPPFHGVVKDSLGVPLSGATVTNKRTKKSVGTGAQGDFTLDVQPGDVLTVSFIGYETKTIPASGDFAEILLNPASSPLDEVQIQAYGKTSRRVGTGNVVTIKGSDIEKQPVTNPLLALTGRVPNLVITPSNGFPNGAVNIQLRGQNSLSNESLRSAPLIIVDGVPFQNNISSGSLGNFSAVGNQVSALSFIDPQQIEQIDVLADADATSIYGSRGGNGVIIITTKRGKSGPTKINGSIGTGFSRVPSKYDLLQTPQYLQMRREGYQNTGALVPSRESADKNYSNFDLTVWDQNRYTDWQELLLGNTARSYHANASVSGGNAGVQYLIGGGFNSQQLVYPGQTKFESGNVMMNLTSTSKNGKLNIGVNGAVTVHSSLSPNSNFNTLAVALAPNAPALYTPDGLLNWEPDPNDTTGKATWRNPLAQLLETSTMRNVNFRGNVDLSYRFSKKFALKATGGYSEIRVRNVSLVPLASKDPASSPTGSSTITSTINQSVTFEPQLTYNDQLGEGKFDVMAGASYQSQHSSEETVSGLGFTSDGLLRNLAAAPILLAFNNSLEYKYIALFGRVSYNWRQKYVFNLSGRRDGSSRFGPGQRFGNFWSAGAAWIFSEESFAKNNLPAVSFGKLRVSYGTSGNDGIGDFQYLELYRPINDYIYQGVRPVRSEGPANVQYRWENIRKLEAALEAGFIRDKILITVAYWRTRSDDQLGRYPLPATAGDVSIVANQDATIQNSGWDFMVNTKNITTPHFSWSTSANFGIYNNQLLAKPGGPNWNAYGFSRFVDIGEPFTGFAVAYDFRGINPSNGLYQFLNAEGNVTVDKDNNLVEALKINTQPLTLGLSNSLSYKKFDLSFFVQFTKQMGRNPLFDYAFATHNPGSFSSQPGGEFGNRPAEWLNNWKKPGDMVTLGRFEGDNYSEPFNVLLHKAINSNLAWTDASFIRLKNIAVGYSLSPALTQKWKLTSLRIFVQAQNILTITNYKGLDPEVQVVTSLPQLRIFTGGIQLSL